MLAIIAELGFARMAIVSVAEAKNRLPALLQAAEGGEVVTITRYGRPIAEIHGITAPPRRKMTGAESMEWLEAQLARSPLPEGLNANALLEAMRDETD